MVVLSDAGRTCSLSGSHSIRETSASDSRRLDVAPSALAVVLDFNYSNALDGGNLLWRDDMTLKPPSTFTEIGNFGRTPLGADERERRAQFALLWRPLKTELAKRGWREFNPGSVVELYVTGSPSSVCSRIWISPTRGEFRVRLDIPSVVVLERLLGNKDNLRPAFPERVRVAREQIKRADGAVFVLEVRTSLELLLGDATSSADMAARIISFVINVVDKVEEIGSAVSLPIRSTPS